MNLRSTDLNLLVILDALLDEAHVSRAAGRLGLSQPAMSQALERCRALFEDQLLIRGGGIMRRTPKAEALRAPLKSLLADASDLIAPPEPDIAAIRRRIRIIMADLPAAIIAGPLLERLARTAPGIDVVVHPWRGAPEALDRLARGECELAVSVFPAPDPSFQRIELIQESFVVVMRKDHPAARNFNLDTWLSYPHILISARGDTSGPVDETLEKLGKSRRIGLVVPSFLIVPSLLASTDMIATLPSRGVPANSDDFGTMPPPIPIEGFSLHLAWHRRLDRDPVIAHVADLIRDLFHAPMQLTRAWR